MISPLRALLKTAAVIAVAAYSATAAADIYVNPARGYPDEIPAGQIDNTGDEPESHTFTDSFGTSDFRITLHFSDLHGTPGRYPYYDTRGKKHHAVCPGWEIALADSCGRGMSVAWRTEVSENALEETVSHARVIFTAPDGTETVYDAPSTMRGHRERRSVVIMRTEGELRAVVTAGDAVEWETELPEDFSPVALTLTSDPGGALSIGSLSTEIYTDPREVMERSAISSGEMQRLVSLHDDPRTGYWGVTGRDIEDKYVTADRCEYIVALVPDREAQTGKWNTPTGSYTLYYIEGAPKGYTQWRQGMVKCRLIPVVGNRYDAQWVTADGTVLHYDVAGVFFDDNTLQITFPRFSSSLTLQRLSGYNPPADLVPDSVDP